MNKRSGTAGSFYEYHIERLVPSNLQISPTPRCGRRARNGGRFTDPTSRCCCRRPIAVPTARTEWSQARRHPAGPSDVSASRGRAPTIRTMSCRRDFDTASDSTFVPFPREAFPVVHSFGAEDTLLARFW